MGRLSIALAVFGWLLAAFPARAGSDPARGVELAARADAYLTAYADAGQFSGVVLIAKGKNVVFQRAYGSADVRTGRPLRLDTAFPIASLSKTFTAAAIVRLARDGRLNINDPLIRYLPDFPNGGAITLDQLMRHVSGVGEFQTPEVYTGWFTLAELSTQVAAAPPLFAPGEGDAYSNEGYVLLARTVEAASGRPFAAYLRSAFFAPLGLSRTGVETGRPVRGLAWGAVARVGGSPAPNTVAEAPIYGASGLYSTAADLHRWALAVRAGAVAGDYRQLRYPYGWGRRTYLGHKLIEQSGQVEGFGSYLAAYEDGYVVVCLSNVMSGMQGRWGPDFAAVIRGGETSLPSRLSLVPMSADAMAALEGDYKAPSIGLPIRLKRRGGGLIMTWGPFPFWRPVSVLGPDRLFVVADYTALAVRRDADGHVTGLAIVNFDDPSQAPLEFARVR